MPDPQESVRSNMGCSVIEWLEVRRLLAGAALSEDVGVLREPHRVSVVVGAPIAGSGPNATDARVPPLADEVLISEVQRRAFDYFIEQSDPNTGLTPDRARLTGTPINNPASIAATGYHLSALPIGVERGWIDGETARARAITSLRFLHDRMPHHHGFFYHFINKQTGAREWSSELSSIDTGILVIGALAAGQYFGGEARTLADAIYERIEWDWMMTNGGSQPGKLKLSHGWKPETGFLSHNYDYCEAVLIYLMGMGSATHPLPAASWDAMSRQRITYRGIVTLVGGPIFMHQLPQNFYPLMNRRDRLGYDYGEVSTNAILINRQYCIDNPARFPNYGADEWGLNASDGPDGYNAFGAPRGPDNGTLSPTGVAASLPFAPDLTIRAMQNIYTARGDRIWGHYGFANAYNVSRNWYDPDVIGLDLGMAMTSIENHQTQLLWRLIASHASTQRAYSAAGIAPTAATVVGRHIFYNNSAFDGFTPDPAASDDGAIDESKQALLPGDSPTGANHTATAQGINGIMLDVAALLENAEQTLDAADFTFRTGPGGDPAGWSAAPPPSLIAIRRGAGAAGTDRVTLVWPDATAVGNAWLEVTLHAGDSGLVSPDVFYVGNLAGDANGDARVTVADVGRVATHFGLANRTVDQGDFTADGVVTVADVGVLSTHFDRSLDAQAFAPDARPETAATPARRRARRPTWAGPF